MIIATDEKRTLTAGKVLVVAAPFGAAARTRALSLLNAGARLVVAGNEADNPAGLAAGLGPDVVAICADVASEQGWRRVVHQTLNRFGRIDGVLNAVEMDDPCGQECLADYERRIRSFG